MRVDLHMAAHISGVKPGTVRRWVHDGRIIRHADGYDVDELLHWIDARNPDALYSRAGLKMSDRPPRECDHLVKTWTARMTADPVLIHGTCARCGAMVLAP